MEKIVFFKPTDVFNFIQDDYLNENREVLYLLTLNTNKCLISKTLIAKGYENIIFVSPKNIFKVAFLDDASFIILVHNHPSLDILPSLDDILFTNRLIKIGKLLGIYLLDHLIVSENDYLSINALHKFDKKAIFERR